MKNEKNIYLEKWKYISLERSYKHIHRGFCFITVPTWEQPYHCSSSSCSNDSFPYLSDYSPMNMFCLIQLKWILNQLKDFQSSLTSKNTVGLIFALYWFWYFYKGSYIFPLIYIFLLIHIKQFLKCSQLFFIVSDTLHLNLPFTQKHFLLFCFIFGIMQFIVILLNLVHPFLQAV